MNSVKTTHRPEVRESVSSSLFCFFCSENKQSQWLCVTSVLSARIWNTWTKPKQFVSFKQRLFAREIIHHFVVYMWLCYRCCLQRGSHVVGGSVKEPRLVGIYIKLPSVKLQTAQTHTGDETRRVYRNAVLALELLSNATSTIREALRDVRMD